MFIVALRTGFSGIWFCQTNNLTISLELEKNDIAAWALIGMTGYQVKMASLNQAVLLSFLLDEPLALRR